MVEGSLTVSGCGQTVHERKSTTKTDKIANGKKYELTNKTKRVGTQTVSQWLGSQWLGEIFSKDGRG